MEMKKTAVLLLTLVLLLASAPFAASAEKDYLCGVDVSVYNGAADWRALKDQGVDFVIMRCFDVRPDSRFDEYYEGALMAGLTVGAYVYMEKTTVEGAKEEARSVIEFLRGRKLDFPLYLDVEEMSILRQSKKNVTDMIRAELDIFKAAGYQTGLYISAANYTYCVDISRMEGESIWLAKWVTGSDYNRKYFGDLDPYSEKKPQYADIWQWTSNGDARYYKFTENFVTRNLDLNYCYTDYSLRGETGLERLEREERERIAREREEREAREKAEREAREQALEIGTQIENADPADYPAPTETLGLTSPYTRGLDVVRVQATLKKLGYRVFVNGIYSEDTYDAVVRFEANYGFTADGSVSTALADYMYRALLFESGKTRFTLRGDVDGDGAVRAADARLLLRYTAGLEYFMPEQTGVADANFDGLVTASDARSILRAVAEVESIEAPAG